MNTSNISKEILLTALFSISFLFVYANGNSSVNFLNKDSFKDVQQEAKNQNKPIFVDFHALWCAPCRKVEKEVFRNTEVATYMNENFINYKVNVEKGNGPMIALIYEIEVLPSVIIVKPNGDILLKKSSYMGSETFLNWAKEGNNKFSSTKSMNKIQNLFTINSATTSFKTSSNHPKITNNRYSNVAVLEKRKLLK